MCHCILSIPFISTCSDILAKSLMEYKERKELETHKIMVDNSLLLVKRKKSLHHIYGWCVRFQQSVALLALQRNIRFQCMITSSLEGGFSPKNCSILCFKLSVQWKYIELKIHFMKIQWKYNSYTLKLKANYFGTKVLILMSSVIWRYFILLQKNFPTYICCFRVNNFLMKIWVPRYKMA